jgi:methionine aminopeptidase
MDDKKFNKYKTVADIIDKSFSTFKELLKPGEKIYHLAKLNDQNILNELNKTYKNLKKGLSMPTCISVNETVCHYAPIENDDYKLKEGDLIRFEVAAHIDNCNVTLGDTLEISTNNFDDIKYLQTAMSTGIKLVEPGFELNQFDKLIKKMTESHGYYLLERPYVFKEPDVKLQYDWSRKDTEKFLEQSWIVKCDEEIDLEDLEEIDEAQLKDNTEFNVNEVYHLEIAVSKDKTSCKVSDRQPTLFQKGYRKYQLKTKMAREVLSEVNKNIGNCVFTLSDLNMQESKAKLGMRECTNQVVLRSLGLIVKKDPVFRIKCSIYIMKNNVYILSGKFNTLEIIDDIETDLEFLKVFNQDSKFNKRYINEKSL